MTKLKKIKIIIISLVLLFPFSVYADCSSEEIARFKEVEEDFDVESKIDYDTKESILIIKFSNTDEFTYSIELDDNIFENCTIKEKNELECKQISPGEYDFQIISSKSNCVAKKIKIKVLKYNQYSEDKLCKEIEEFYLCQTEIGEDIDYNEFVSRIKIYKKSKEKNESTANDNQLEEKNALIDYMDNNKTNIIIISIFSILVIVTIVLTIKSQKDRSVLK